MARSSRFRESVTNSSSGHIAIGEVLYSIFPLGKIYQEYPLDMILKKGYKRQGIDEKHQDKFMIARARKLHADWVVLDMGLVVEFHGEHHFRAVDYGDGKGEENLQHRQHLDRVKRNIIRESGFVLIEWPYYESLDEQSFMDKLEEVF